MPDEDATYAPYGEDLYPASEDEHALIVTWCQQTFLAADSARRTFEDRWSRFHKLYMSWVQLDKSDWRSKVFIPFVFSTVETIAPRLVAELPKAMVAPMGPEDTVPAQAMETLLDWSADNSDLHLELIEGVKSMLKYGTGILKTFHRQDLRTAYHMVPQVEPVYATQQVPVTDPTTGQPFTDLNGAPQFEENQVMVGMNQGAPALEPYTYVAYDGPAAESVDIFNFWVAPEATDIQNARYTIQRSFREMSHILKKVEEGVYRLPPEMGPEEITSVNDEPLAKRLSSIDMGTTNTDPTRKPVELLEFWTDDNRVITIANRKAVLRVQDNPFQHQEKPYVRMVDYLQEHEFWGVGEIQAIEPLQDIYNALVNQRIDNVRLNLNSVFAVNKEAIDDPRQLRLRPGAVIETKGDMPVQEAFQRVDLGDVTQSAFLEASEIERVMEKITGVTAYQTGADNPNLNDTATGVALISEQGNTKFNMKLRLVELMALKPMFRQWGAIIQQFTPAERVIRMLGPNGQWLFQSFDPESIQGALDYDIEASSSAQTDTVRREQDLTLLQTLSAVWPYAVPKLVQDILQDYGKKDLDAYLMGPQYSLGGQDPMQLLAQQQQMNEPVPPGQENQNLGQPAPTPGQQQQAQGGGQGGAQQPYQQAPPLPPSLTGAQVQERLSPADPNRRR